MTGHVPSGNIPINDPGSLHKTIDSIPTGEVRSQFSFTAGNFQNIFTNPESIAVEVCEVFFQSTGNSIAQLFVGGSPITAPLELFDSQGYSDSGFMLTQGQNVSMTVIGAGTVAGFIRWRYA